MKDQLIPLTQKLIGFQTLNPPGNELEIVLFLEKLLKEAGFSTFVQEFIPGRADRKSVV